MAAVTKAASKAAVSLALRYTKRVPGQWKRVIGILGGLGPEAHIALERHLLAKVDAKGDQDYPPWVLSSLPQTPDRTEALEGRAPSPVPLLLESLRRLEGSADFAVMACNTAHAFLPELRAEARLPILDVVGQVTKELSDRCGRDACVGLLATSGTLRSRVYPQTAAQWAPGLSWLSLTDLDGGQRLQDELVMRTVYGKPGVVRSGIKAGLRADPETGQPYSEPIRQAAARLVDAGADVIVLGCTEIPLALEGSPPLAVPTLDPMEVAADASLRIAAGVQDLPPVEPVSTAV